MRRQEFIAITAEECSDLENVTTDAANIQQWKAKLLQDKIVSGAKSGEILDLLKVENGRLRELGFTKEHNIHELVENADARGGFHVHAKCLPDHEGAFKQQFCR